MVLSRDMQARNPATSVALPLPLPARTAGPRSLVDLHRDALVTTWKLGPVVLAVAAAHVPFTLVSALAEREDTLALHALSAAGSVAWAFVGYPLATLLVLCGVRALAAGEQLGARALLDAASGMSGRFMVTWMGTWLRVVAGIVLLVIPGLVLTMRWWLVDAVTVLLGIGRSEARALAAEVYRARPWFVAGALTLMAVLYWMPYFTVNLALNEGLLASILSQAIFDALGALSVCVSAVVLAEVRGLVSMRAPVGRTSPERVVERRMSGSAVPVFLAAIALAVGSMSLSAGVVATRYISWAGAYMDTHVHGGPPASADEPVGEEE